MEGMGGKVLDHGREHVVESDGRVYAQDQIVNKDKGGHGSARLALLGGLGVGRLGDDAGNLADLGVEQGDGGCVGGGDGQRGPPVHEEVIVFREGNTGGHWSCFHFDVCDGCVVWVSGERCLMRRKVRCEDTGTRKRAGIEGEEEEEGEGTERRKVGEDQKTMSI